MGIGYGPRVITDGLVLALDAADVSSYPGSGTTWTDLSGNGNNGTLVNGVGYDNGSLIFDGNAIKFWMVAVRYSWICTCHKRRQRSGNSPALTLNVDSTPRSKADRLPPGRKSRFESAMAIRSSPQSNCSWEKISPRV